MHHILIIVYSRVVLFIEVYFSHFVIVFQNVTYFQSGCEASDHFQQILHMNLKTLEKVPIKHIGIGINVRIKRFDSKIWF